MSKSKEEEIIGILWMMFSLTLFDRDFIILGIVALCLGIFAIVCSVIFAIMKVYKEHLEKPLKK